MSSEIVIKKVELKKEADVILPLFAFVFPFLLAGFFSVVDELTGRLRFDTALFLVTVGVVYLVLMAFFLKKLLSCFVVRKYKIKAREVDVL